MVKRGSFTRNFLMEKRGQVAIFVIVAIVILAVILVIIFYPRITNLFPGQSEFSPSAFLKTCIGDEVSNNIEVIAKQGGYLNPEGFLVYKGEKIKYLCYVSGYYKTCVVQEPMVKNHFEQELARSVEPKARECVRSLVDEYKQRGYSVSNSRVDSKVEIIPNKIRVTFEAPMTITRGDEESRTFSEFIVEIDSEMYELLFIAQSIVEFEASYGDSETSAYIQYYPNLRMEKLKLEEGSKLYTLTNVITNEQFRFASRSLAWPPGYGLE